MRFLTTALLLLVSMSFVSAATDDTNDDDSAPRAEVMNKLPPFPTTRFTAWDALPSQIRAQAEQTGYYEKAWNKPGKAEWENLDYKSLEDDMVEFVDSIGMTPAQWDCWINHYRNYRWDDLGEHKNAYVALGWTHEGWAKDDTTTKIEGKYWEGLTRNQKDSALSVCYDEHLWDEVEIPLWEEDDGSGGETDEKDNKDLYSNEEKEVADQKQDIYENLYDENDRSKADFEGPASAHNTRGIEIPFFRYQPWDLLSEEYQKLALAATYDEKSWNAIGSHKFESKDFETLGKLNNGAQLALKQMGFTEDSWDCYMSHYLSYEWSELLDAGVQTYYQQLGYDHKMWDEDTKSATDGVYWPDLTPAQQNAAYEIGYFREVWDEVSLQFWPRTTSNTLSLKKYAKEHPMKAGGGAVITLTIIVGLIFACGYCMRAKSRAPHPYPTVEMYGNSGLGGFGQSYKDEPENVQFDDDDDDDEKKEADRNNNARIV